jgi:hypothetical protein
MRKLIAITLLFALLIPAGELLLPAAAKAAVYESASAVVVRQRNSDEIGDLLLTWKETGLTPGVQMSYSVYVASAVNYLCPDGSIVSSTAGYTGSAIAIPNRRGIASPQVLFEEPASPDPSCTTLCSVDYSTIQVADGALLTFTYPDAAGTFCK